MEHSIYDDIKNLSAELEGAYRFFQNKSVTPSTLLHPHLEHTADRVNAGTKKGLVHLVVHDTTEIAPRRSEPKDEMGFIKGGQRGLFLHNSLAVELGAPGLPLGVLSYELYHRPPPSKEKKTAKTRREDPNNESLRWLRGVQAARAQVGPEPALVHVMDREGDDYRLFHSMVEAEESFVIRQMHDRLIGQISKEDPRKLVASLEGKTCVAEREVTLSERKKSLFKKQQKIHPPRKRRQAHLQIRFTEVVLLRPESTSQELAPQLPLSVVHVFEPDPPEGEPAVDWKLLTTLPVLTSEDALNVVDIYRQRWIIEEYFKALKTGTNLLARQMESVHAIENVIALSMPLAWRLLVLRSMSRRHPELPATLLFNDIQLKILAKLGRRKLSKEPTIIEATYAVAALAGHLKRNGPPGWLLLAKGLQKLQDMEKGWREARAL